MWRTYMFCVSVVAAGMLLAVGGCGPANPPPAANPGKPATDSPAGPAVWTCPMHPQIRTSAPGRCPICGMDLVPVKSEPPTGKSAPADGSTPAEQPGTPSGVPGHAAVTIPGELQQRIGVRIGRVEKGPLRATIRAVGIVEPDETRLARVSIKTEGWVDKLAVNFVGQTVRKGDPLLTIYSPQFFSTQQELLTALRIERTLGDGQRQNTLADAARRRLELWDVPPAEIDRVVQTGRPQKDLTLRSPIDGTVLERNVFRRQYVTPEKELYVIGDLSTVWVQAKVYEYEIPHVALGQPAAVTIASLPNRQFAGKVVFVQPTVDPATRTVQVRIALPNPEGVLKPGTFAQVALSHAMGEGLLVPVSAILRTGEQDIAYRAAPGGRFVPVAVKLGPAEFDGQYQILDGLKEGDRIAISANFLIDSESRIRAGSDQP